MKRIINVTLIILFCAAAFVFNFAGSTFRDALAPRVKTAPIQQTRMGNIVPEEAVRYNEETDEHYICLAVPSERYPERGLEVKYVKCQIDTTVDEGTIVYIMEMINTYDATVIISSDKEIFEGQRVITDND